MELRKSTPPVVLWLAQAHRQAVCQWDEQCRAEGAGAVAPPLAARTKLSSIRASTSELEAP